MENGQKIAEITIDTKSQQIQNITFYGKRLRFKCQRCAIFCCKLGGPKLSEKDVERLRQIRSNTLEFLNNNGYLKSREDGSCIFLKFDAKNKVYECSIYNFRPNLCILYPFHVEVRDPNSYTLELIPCCNGLNTEDGELVNKNFITKYLLNAFLDPS